MIISIDHCAKDGGQEISTIILCSTLNFDQFDWLNSPIQQRIMVKSSLTPSFLPTVSLQWTILFFSISEDEIRIKEENLRLLLNDAYTKVFLSFQIFDQFCDIFIYEIRNGFLIYLDMCA